MQIIPLYIHSVKCNLFGNHRNKYLYKEDVNIITALNPPKGKQTKKGSDGRKWETRTYQV